MILNVSGRCDIVAFYTEWFMNRYHEGYVDVKNPFYPRIVSRIYFNDVDAILFCTKNPIPIVDKLKEIKKPIIFHVTLTPYKKDVEINVPDKKLIIEAIKKISNIVGINNLYLRYDPIFISKKYSLDYHIKAFDRLCTLLDGYVNKIIISFLDNYKNVEKNIFYLKPIPFSSDDYKKLGINFSRIAGKHGMTVQTCFEKINLVEYGFVKKECLSKEMAYNLTGKNYSKWIARKGGKCNCVEMVDIGVYNSCKHYCKYCYANYNEGLVKSNMARHNPKSSLLIGELSKDDIIKERKN